MPRPDNRERNSRIIELASQGKALAAIARELRLSPGVVLGVVHRARKAGTTAPPPAGGGQAQESAPETPPPSTHED